MRHVHWLLIAVVVGGLGLAGCKSDGDAGKVAAGSTDPSAKAHQAMPKGDARYVTAVHKNGLHIAIASSEAAKELREKGHFAKPITAVGARVDGMKVMAADEQTLALYLNW